MGRRVKGAARITIGLAASLGLGWLAIRGLDWGLVGGNLANVSTTTLALAVLVFMCAAWLRAARWRILFVTQKPSIARLFIIQHEGLGFSNLMPFRLTSEVTQLAVLTLRDGVHGPTALATLGMERVLDVVASTAILGIAFFIVPEMGEFKLFVWGAVGFAIVAVAVVRLFAWSDEKVRVIKRFKFLAAFATAVRDLERQRFRLLGSLLVTFVYWLLVGVTAWIISMAVDLSINPLTATLVILGTIFFATAVPAAPSAMGTFEFAVVYVLKAFDIDKTESFPFAVLAHAVFFLPPTIIAALFLPREGINILHRRRKPAAVNACPDPCGLY